MRGSGTLKDPLEAWFYSDAYNKNGIQMCQNPWPEAVTV